MLRYVTIRKFSEMSGYTEKAVYRKIEDGIWVEGQQYCRAPDNRILMNLEGYEKWAEGDRAQALRRSPRQ
jgi:hypothetical protein